MPDFNPNNPRENLSLDEIEEQEQAEKKAKKAKFNIFNRAFRDGQGVSKEEIAISKNPTLANFFKLTATAYQPP